eukprot:8493687-Pyramimonas_sp.AAC.1
MCLALLTCVPSQKGSGPLFGASATAVASHRSRRAVRGGSGVGARRAPRPRSPSDPPHGVA